MSIELVTAFTFDMLARLHSGEVDAALVTSPPDNAAITTICVATHQFKIVMRKKHPLAGKKSVELRGVADYPWVFFERKVHPILYDGILRRMQEENLRPRIQHQVF